MDRVEKNAQFKEDIVCDGVLGVYSLSKGILHIREVKQRFVCRDYQEQQEDRRQCERRPYLSGALPFRCVIYQIQKVELVKIPSQNEEYANMKYCSMIEEVMKTANLYYSHHMDLTKRLQSG